MEIKVKLFDELTKKELYEILKMRTEIFVVEQNCVYQDMDDKDYESLHVFYEEDGKIIAYLRAFSKEAGIIQMGRVVTLRHGMGFGGKILKEGIHQIREKFCPRQIYIEAQCQAIGFYEREGFWVCSEEFLEDGIPHSYSDDTKSINSDCLFQTKFCIAKCFTNAMIWSILI